jgi:hypothetical protein
MPPICRLAALLLGHGGRKLDHFPDKAGPTGLVTGSKARAVVSMEVFVEEDVVLPVRIGLEFLRTAVHGAAARLISQEYALQAIGDFACNFEQIHQITRPGRAFDLEVVAIVEIELQQSANQQRIHRHPDGPAPIGIPPEHSRVRFCRQVVHTVLMALHMDDIRMCSMVA